MTENVSLEEVGRVMADRLKSLDEERAKAEEAKALSEKAAQERIAANQQYAAKIQEVRDEGYVTDALLKSYGHEVARRRGRPAKNAAPAPAPTT